jgi:vanillate/3-O-methylgallate O-demethylase
MSTREKDVTFSSLEARLQAAGGAANMLHTSRLGNYVFPVPAEFSNWRDETEAWSNTAVLLDQSHHMTDLYIEGPDTIRLLSDIGINNFRNFGRNKAKQFVACNFDGHVIGDAVLFGLEDQKVNLVGRPHIPNWVQYNAIVGGYDVQIDRDERTLANAAGRKTYRFEIQGPNAWEILERLHGGSLPEMKFFAMGEVGIAGRQVRALKHGMAAAPGLEIWGPAEEAEEIRAAILEAGRDLGLVQGGARAYSTASTESGWLASVLPAVYSGENMRAYREWLSGDSFEATASLGGSYYTNNVEDYYITPWDAGYKFIDFEHDFIGRDALSQFNAGDRFKFMEMPASYYATFPFDQVLSGGKRVGLSTYPVYSTNARRWISLAMVDQAFGETGQKVSVLWGEPNGGSPRPAVERHIQTEISAIVGPSPMPATVRESYRPEVSAMRAGVAA